MAQTVTKAQDTVIFTLGTEFEEDIEAVQHAMVKELGPNGRIIYPVTKNVVTNAVLVTKRHGKVWYGDIDMVESVDVLSQLGIKIGSQIEVQRM